MDLAELEHLYRWNAHSLAFRHWVATVAMILTAGVTYISLRLISAPFGRHVRAGWGPTIPNRLGWVLMEAPGSLAFLWFYLRGPNRLDPAAITLCALWQVHYVHRAFIYPLRTRTTGKRMPLLIAALAFAFNVANAWLNATWIACLATYHAWEIVNPVLWAGVAVFFWGLSLNIRADLALIALRKPGETGYRIPRGPLFRWISAPNYVGEMVEWLGFALASRSPAAVAFAFYTAANLIPRALDTHRWYQEKFPDYPSVRRAIIPIYW